MANDDGREDLLRRARELQARAGEARRESDDSSATAAERWLKNNPTVQAARGMSERVLGVLGPIGRLIAWVAGWIGRWLRWVFFDPEDGISGARAFRNLLISVAAVIGLHVVWSAIYYYSTYFSETVYVTGKQEIVTGELYQFGGCTSLPCSTESDNGKFYLIESSLYFPVMYYPEEEVFANVPQQDAACNVEGYGIYFRTLRWVYKTLQLYQHVVDVSCRPYTEAETRRAVSEGEIVRDPRPED